MDADQDWQSGKTLAESNRILLEKNIATDVTFIFPGNNHKVKAHKIILMSRSHVFYVMFTTSLQNPDEDIPIKDIEPVVFKQLLRFLYCEDDVITAKNALHLMYAAQKYQVDVLKAKCVDYLQNSIDQTTVALILNQAVLYNEAKLSQKCLDFFLDSKSLAGIDEYHVSKETLEVVISCDTLSVSELSVFKACIEWANVECRKLGLEVNMDNRRKVLGSVLRKIRFCSMRQEEFANDVAGSGLLNAQEELAIFKFLCATNKSDPPFPSYSRIQCQVQLPIQLCVRQGHDTALLPFEISITAARRFKLFGFIFVNKGTFNLRLDENEIETFIVQKPNDRVFLSKPLQYETNGTFTISANTVLPLPKIKTQTQTFSYRQGQNAFFQDNASISFSVSFSGWQSTPFRALLVTF